MTSNDPDPHAFESWEDAFQYPIPAVRKFEQQLRQHADENGQKLRSLVGVSYRDLLGTAERIVVMADQIQQVEVTLEDTGHRCNSRAVEKLFSNYSTYRSDVGSWKRAEYGLASEMAILQSCPTIISRLLKRSQSSLLAAKILLLSRLTHMTLAKRQDAPPFIGTIHSRLISLRRKLLQAIDRRLSDPNADAPVLVEEMCAFSLATSSTSTDVLRHFHHVRLDAINRRLDASRANHDDVVNAMKLYIRTLRESQVIFPKRLSDALSRLRTQPLLQEKDVRATSELSLHLHERWMAEELRNYTPWARHDELSSSEATEQLKAWARQALDAFLTGTKALLQRTEQPASTGQSSESEGSIRLEAIMSLRKAVLQAWPWSGAQFPGLAPADVVDQLRRLFNDQLAAEAQKSTSLIDAFLSQLQELAESSSRYDPLQPSLWSRSLLHTPLTAGAEQFKSSILAAYSGQPPYGQSAAIRSCISRYESFLNMASSLRGAVKTMRETRWDDNELLADPETDDGDADADIEERQHLLSDEDPRELEDALTEALEAVTQSLNGGLTDIVFPITEKQPARMAEDEVSSSTLALLRVLREVQRRNLAANRPALPFSVIHSLHAHLASAAVGSALQSIRTSLIGTSGARKRTQPVIARPLWEGTPALPIMPSPNAFKSLKALEKTMAGFGADLWSAGAVREVKRTLAEGVAKVVREVVGSLEKEREDGEAGVNESENNERDDEHNRDGGVISGSDKRGTELMIQMLFDALYIQRATITSGAEEDGLVSVVDLLVGSAELGESEMARLKKSAAEYWKRSYLLFALLAG